MLGLSRYLWNNFKKNINDAFDNWDAWSGGQGDAENQDEYHDMVTGVKNKVNNVIEKLENLDEIHVVMDMYQNIEGIFFNLKEAQDLSLQDKGRYYISSIKFSKNGRVLRNFHEVSANLKTKEVEYLREVLQEGKSGEVKTNKVKNTIFISVQSTRGHALRVANEIINGNL